MKFFHRHLIEVMGKKKSLLLLVYDYKENTESKLHEADYVISSHLHECLNLYRFIQIKVKSNTFVNCLEVK